MAPSITRLSQSKSFVLALGASIFIGPTSLAIFMPAIPAIRAEFGINLQSAQLSLTLPLIATLLTPLVVGRLVDKIGRRPVLLICQLLIIIGCLMCIFTQIYSVLVVGRVLVGVFSTACMIIGRAIVADVYKGPDLARVAARYTIPPVLGIILAPIIGGFIIEASSWRETFWFVFAISSVLMALTWKSLPETKDTSATAQASDQNITIVLKSKILWGFFGQSSCHFAIAFAFAGIAPHIVVGQLGHAVTAYAFGLLAVLGGLLGGIITAERFNTTQPNTMMVFYMSLMGTIASIAGVTVMVALALPLTPLSLFVPAILVAYFIGAAMPYSQAGIISTIENQAGTASGISTALQMLAAAGLTHLFAFAWAQPHIAISTISAGIMVLASAFTVILLIQSRRALLTNEPTA